LIALRKKQLPFRKKVAVLLLVAAFVVAAFAVCNYVPLSTIKIEVFNTRFNDTAVVAVFMENGGHTVVQLEPREKVVVKYHVTDGRYVFAFAWKYGSEASSMLPYTSYTRYTFIVDIGRMDTEWLYWNV
jgi:hypothetical protein